MREKLKYLIKNLSFFTISNLVTKILSFLIVPFYTYYLTTEEYAIIDLVNLVISLVVPAVTLCIDDALLRFSIANNDKKNYIFHISLVINGIGCVIVSLLYPIYKYFNFLSGYELYFIIIFYLTAFNNMYSKYARAIDKINVVMVASICNTATLLLLNVFFISVLGMKENGYFASMIFALGISNIIYIIKIKRPQLKYKSIDRNIAKRYIFDMLAYSIPLVPNALFWWINSALDRMAINMLISLGAAGVYSIANKIPSIMSIFVNVFHQAWNLSAFKEYEEKDYKFFEMILVLFSSCMAIIASGLMVVVKLLASIMFQNDFFDAWRYVPVLLIAFFFNSINTFLGTLYTASKKTKGLFTTTLSGAVVNIVLNLALIPILGIMGAAIATCISNMIVFVARMIFTKKQFEIKISIKYVCTVFILLSFQAVLLLNDLLLFNGLLFVIVIFVTIINVVNNNEIQIYFKNKRS